MPKPPKNPIETVRRIAAAVSSGEMRVKDATEALGISRWALYDWMKRNGYPHNERIRMEPTERDLKALREYWRRDCTQQDVMQYTGRSYVVVHRWITQGIGKEK